MQEEFEKLLIKAFFTFKDPESKEESEKELVLLKDGLTDLLIESESEVPDDIQKRVLIGMLFILYFSCEDVDVPLERELVHRIQLGQLKHGEIQC